MNNSHQDSLFAWIRILRQENVFLPAFWQIHLEQCLLSQGGPQRISVSKFFTMRNKNYAFSILNLLFLSKQKKGSFKSLFPFTYFESLKNTHQSGGGVWWLRHVQLSATPWTVAHQAPLSVEFFLGKNTGVGCHFLLQKIKVTALNFSVILPDPRRVDLSKLETQM